MFDMKKHYDKLKGSDETAAGLVVGAVISTLVIAVLVLFNAFGGKS